MLLAEPYNFKKTTIQESLKTQVWSLFSLSFPFEGVTQKLLLSKIPK